MVKNHNLAESICEMNFGEFRRMLEYKARWYNRKIVFVNRFYPSSKTCHSCGYINKNLKLSDRQWMCPICGGVIERDYNATLNILDEGLRIMGSVAPNLINQIGCSTSEFGAKQVCSCSATLVDYPTTERWQHRNVLTVDDRTICS